MYIDKITHRFSKALSIPLRSACYHVLAAQVLLRSDSPRITPVISGQSPVEQIFRTSLFTAIKELDKRVRVALDGYIYTINPQLLDDFNRLKLLHVSLLNVPLSTRHGGPTYSSFDGIPSKALATVLQQNQEIKHLGIRLHAMNNARMSHELVPIEQAHALENIGQAVPQLDSLSLEGLLHFNDRAWSSWSKVWTNLRSISIRGHEVAHEVVNHLQGCLPSLRSFRLEPWHSLHPQNTPFDSDSFQTSVRVFLSSLRLSRLSLVHCASDTLFALDASASTLRRLCFHHHHRNRSLPLATNLMLFSRDHGLLKAQHLEYLRSTCSDLEWLAFDVEIFHLSCPNGTEAPGIKVPISGPSRATIQARKDIMTSRTPGWRDIPRLRSQLEDNERSDSGSEQEDPIFKILASYSTLRHLRLFVDTHPFHPWSLSITDTIYLFLYFNRRETSCRLQSLVIGNGPTPLHSFWTIYELGDDKVFVSDVSSKQIWDVSDYANLQPTERSKMHFGGRQDHTKQLKEGEEFRMPTEWSDFRV